MSRFGTGYAALAFLWSIAVREPGLWTSVMDKGSGTLLSDAVKSDQSERNPRQIRPLLQVGCQQEQKVRNIRSRHS
jgi:hypothetical protein